VYRFDPTSNALKRDSEGPLNLATLASYQRADAARIRKALTYLRRERYCDLWVDKEDLKAGINWRETIDGVILALIDDAPVPQDLVHYPRVQIFGDAHRTENQRLDDLVVRLYWLIHRNANLRDRPATSS